MQLKVSTSYIGRVLGLMATLACAGETATAAEGGASLYLPGAAGDILLAVPPKPGAAVTGGVFIQSGSAGSVVLQGAVNLGLDLDIVLNTVGASYTFDLPMYGITYTIGAVVPFGSAELEGTITGPRGRTFSASADTFNLADIAITPLAVNSSLGDFHFRFAETIIAPTGDYDLSNTVNMGRNYWAFDTVGAVTYFNTTTGTEISIAPGIMVNTRNQATDYRTGTEFHVDFTANQFLSKTFAVGARGYFYKQLTGDDGAGAILGDFKSESYGLGPGFLWQPKLAGGKLSIAGKYMRDITATNRFKSHFVTIGAAWNF